MKIGPSIRRYRKIKGFTQADIEEQSGISQSYLSQIEKGDRSPSLETLKTLSDCLGIPLPLLIFDSLEEEDVHENKRDLLSDLKPVFEKLLSE